MNGGDSSGGEAGRVARENGSWVATLPAMVWIGLGLLGVAVGCLGTLIGAGGGFLLMPILVMLYPRERPETLASISLAVVFFNALSGSIGYARQKKIDYPAGLLFAATGVPGAVIGALVTGLIPRTAFDLWLGLVLVIIAGYLLLAGPIRDAAHDDQRTTVPHARSRGAIISFGVGFLSSLLGIGGGIIHVPILVYLLKFPVHVAAATSHFVLTSTAGAGTLVHIFSGAFHTGWRRTIALGIGVVIGAQIGAMLSRRTPPGIIMKGLAVGLLAAGVRVAWMALGQIP